MDKFKDIRRYLQNVLESSLWLKKKSFIDMNLLVIEVSSNA